MPVYQKSKNKWRVRIWSQGRIAVDETVNGLKRDALAHEARKRAELEAGTLERRVAPTFSDFCLTEYQVHARSHLSPKTWTNRRYQIAELVEAFGDIQLTHITPRDIEQYKTRRRRSVGPSTVNDELKVLRAVLQYARDIHVPTRLPKIKRFKVTKRRVRAWSLAQVSELYKAARRVSPRMLPIIAFLVNTGCRKGEAIALRWENVDLERGLLYIYPTELDDDDEWQPKNAKPREIPMADCLRPYLAGGADGYVFPTRFGGPYKYWPQNQFDRARKAAGLKGGPHTLRHTYASHFLAKQPDLYLLSQILGHSYQRTSALYAHLLPDHLERARNAVSLPVSLELVEESKA